MIRGVYNNIARAYECLKIGLTFMSSEQRVFFRFEMASILADRTYGLRRLTLRNLAGVALLSLAGCNAFPSAGPSRPAVLSLSGPMEVVPNSAAASKVPTRYVAVALTPAIAARLSAGPRGHFFSQETLATREAQIRVGIGDMLDVSIFEAEAGGLFSGPVGASAVSGNRIQLQTQQVDASGKISIPFGGRIQAAGLTPVQIQTAINASLASRALEPQAVVTVSDRRSSQISVLGEVGTPIQFSVDPGGVRLFSAIARAGGSKFPSYESTIVLRRAGRTERALLSDVVADDNANVELQPGDVVYILHEQRYFMSFGAPINRRFLFDGTRLTLTDALGEAGGLADNQADPASVFLYRNERKSLLLEMGINVPDIQGDRVPTIYVANMRDPGGLFLAGSVEMENHDVIFVANAASVEFNKIIGTLLPLTQSASNAALAGGI